jgi:DNA-binding transcriptional LysR family regulator
MMHQIDLSRTDLNLLVLYEAVMDERHVGRAATRLSLSPSAVSHGLGRLRTQLNDPLFLKTPRGVVPTDRALSLAEPIGDILSRVRSVVATSEPFDPATSQRRFVIASPDATSVVPLAPLLADLAVTAPGIDIGTRQIMPDVSQARPWDPAFRALDARQVDLAAITFSSIPSRFVGRPLYTEDFVVAARKGHPFLADPSIDAYCAASHVVVSTTGDTGTFVGEMLSAQGRSRRVQLTVPHFIVAVSVIAETDLIASLPRRTLERYARRFGIVGVPPPFDQGPPSVIQLVAPRVAMADTGLAWLVERIETITQRHVSG